MPRAILFVLGCIIFLPRGILLVLGGIIFLPRAIFLASKHYCSVSKQTFYVEPHFFLELGQIHSMLNVKPLSKQKKTKRKKKYSAEPGGLTFASHELEKIKKS